VPTGVLIATDGRLAATIRTASVPLWLANTGGSCKGCGAAADAGTAIIDNEPSTPATRYRMQLSFVMFFTNEGISLVLSAKFYL